MEFPSFNPEAIPYPFPGWDGLNPAPLQRQIKRDVERHVRSLSKALKYTPDILAQFHERFFALLQNTLQQGATRPTEAKDDLDAYIREVKIIRNKPWMLDEDLVPAICGALRAPGAPAAFQHDMAEHLAAKAAAQIDINRAQWWARLRYTWPWASYGDNPADFIDIPDIRQQYCKLRKPGYDALRWTLITREDCLNRPLNAQLEQALQRDSVPSFNIWFLLEQKQKSFGLLRRAMAQPAPFIAEHILETALQENKKTFSVEHLLYFICGTPIVPEEMTVSAIHTVERHKPGIIASTIDPLGNNLLWYAYVYRCVCSKSQLIYALLKYGVDPDHRNHLNLSYSLISAATYTPSSTQRDSP